MELQLQAPNNQLVDSPLMDSTKFSHALPLLTKNNYYYQTRIKTRPVSAMKTSSGHRNLHLTLKRVCLSFKNSQISSASFDTTELVKRMATKTNQAAIDDKDKVKKEEASGESKKSSPPPPPEKPEPGDCCGSGCVRCVWDVYYEELEEYNKLYGDCESNKSKSG